jgi:hypothetical protein
MTSSKRLSSNSTFSLSSALTTDSFHRDKIPYAIIARQSPRRVFSLPVRD